MDQEKPAIFAVVASLLALAIAIWKLIPPEGRENKRNRRASV
jgi:hypothetical protein